MFIYNNFILVPPVDAESLSLAKLTVQEYSYKMKKGNALPIAKRYKLRMVIERS